MSLTDLERAQLGSILSTIVYKQDVVDLDDPANFERELTEKADEDEPTISTSMASKIATTFDFIEGFNFASGLQGAVFYHTTREEYILALAGTEGPYDVLADLQIASSGIAIAQFDSLVSVIDQIRGMETDHGPITNLEVVGHSLGGHLALLSRAIAPDLVSKVTTFNGAGIGLATLLTLESTASLHLAGVSFPELVGRLASGDIVEYEVPGDIVADLPTLFHFGRSVDIGSDGDTQLFADPTFATHSIGNIAASTAYFKLLNAIDPNIGFERAIEIFRSMANVADESLARSLTFWAELYGVPVSTGVEAGLASNEDSARFPAQQTLLTNLNEALSDGGLVWDRPIPQRSMADYAGSQWLSPSSSKSRSSGVAIGQVAADG